MRMSIFVGITDFFNNDYRLNYAVFTTEETFCAF